MKTLRIVLVALVALAAGVVAGGGMPARAQTLLYTLNTPNPQPGGSFGLSVAVGDVNGDGKADIAVGALYEDVGGSSQGRAYVFSGADGSLHLTLDTPNPQTGARFGGSVAVGEVNGDGKADIAVGARLEDVGGNVNQGRAYVFSGADGSVLLTLDSPNPQEAAYFGLSVAVGDVNGDGKADIAVGADEEDVGGNTDQGRSYVFSGADASLLLTLDTPNPQAGVAFGHSVAVGEVNGDGKADIAVGAPEEDVGGNEGQGRAYVFSGDDGSLLHTLDTPNPQADAGFSCSAVGDVNGDGKADIAARAPKEDVAGNEDQGRAYVFSGDDGSLLHTLDTPNPGGTRFGWSVAVGDVNADGKADIAVGAYGESAVHAFSGAAGSLLLTVESPNPQPGGLFGRSVALGDVNGDGKGEIAVGAPSEDVGGNERQGRAYVFSGVPIPVGGVAELPDASGPAGRNYGALAALAAAVLVALSAGGWYARRRWLD